VTEENVQKLTNEYDKKKEERNRIASTSIRQMWLDELDVLRQAYLAYREERRNGGLTTSSLEATSTSQSKKRASGDSSKQAEGKKKIKVVK
jgi:hypothetical protein